MFNYLFTVTRFQELKVLIKKTDINHGCIFPLFKTTGRMDKSNLNPQAQVCVERDQPIRPNREIMCLRSKILSKPFPPKVI